MQKFTPSNIEDYKTYLIGLEIKPTETFSELHDQCDANIVTHDFISEELGVQLILHTHDKLLEAISVINDFADTYNNHCSIES